MSETKKSAPAQQKATFSLGTEETRSLIAATAAHFERSERLGDIIKRVEEVEKHWPNAEVAEFRIGKTGAGRTIYITLDREQPNYNDHEYDIDGEIKTIPVPEKVAAPAPEKAEETEKKTVEVKQGGSSTTKKTRKKVGE